jgi:phosphoglycerate dehydrogenase-like enzyme
MQTFHVAYTGDFLDASGASAYGDIGRSLLDRAPHIRYHFLMDQAPRGDDPDYWRRFYSLEVTAEQIAAVHGLIVLRPRITQRTFARGAEHLIAIGRSGAGYDKVDLEACTANDVVVFNVPMALDHATASTALLFMLALAKRLPEQERITRAGRWDLQASVMGSEIEGRTLGIVGLGRSGRELVRLAQPFAMRVLAYSPHAEGSVARALGVQLVTLDDLLRDSDFISLHARLTPETRGLIGPEQLAAMKPSAYLINVARGELVVQSALAAALQERRIAGAALDVFETEPLPPDDPLTSLNNVILTPHWSASTSDIWRATGRATATGMLDVASGRIPQNVVNPAVLERRGFQAKLAARAGPQRF